MTDRKEIREAIVAAAIAELEVEINGQIKALAEAVYDEAHGVPYQAVPVLDNIRSLVSEVVTINMVLEGIGK